MKCKFQGERVYEKTVGTSSEVVYIKKNLPEVSRDFTMLKSLSKEITSVIKYVLVSYLYIESLLQTVVYTTVEIDTFIRYLFAECKSNSSIMRQDQRSASVCEINLYET